MLKRILGPGPGLALRALGIAYALVFALGCNTDAEPVSSGSTSASSTTTSAAEEPRTLSGGGELNTEPFRLAGGDYTAAYDFGGDCYYSIDIEGPSQDAAGTGDGPIADTTVLYGLDAGEYHLEVITGPTPNCPWTVTLTPRG